MVEIQNSKYNHNEIVDDYVSGFSFPELRSKYGITLSHAHRIVRKHLGFTRNGAMAQLLKSSGQTEWHKLTPIGNSTTRLISIPTTYLLNLNLNPIKHLVGKWTVIGQKLTLEIRYLDEVQKMLLEACP